MLAGCLICTVSLLNYRPSIGHGCSIVFHRLLDCPDPMLIASQVPSLEGHVIHPRRELYKELQLGSLPHYQYLEPISMLGLINGLFHPMNRSSPESNLLVQLDFHSSSSQHSLSSRVLSCMLLLWIENHHGSDHPLILVVHEMAVIDGFPAPTCASTKLLINGD